jgi:hypothetical protein
VEFTKPFDHRAWSAPLLDVFLHVEHLGDFEVGQFLEIKQRQRFAKRQRHFLQRGKHELRVHFADHIRLGFQNGGSAEVCKAGLRPRIGIGFERRQCDDRDAEFEG